VADADGLRVLVRYFAGAAAAAGTDEERLEVAPWTTAADLAVLLGQRHPGLVRVLEVASLLVDEVAVRDRSQPLVAAGREDVQVDVLPPFAGG
jgi:molybdopterin converting factor small subunit